MTDVTIVGNQQALERIIAETAKVVVNFSGLAWCRPCIQFHPHWLRAAGEVNDIRFVEIDVDTFNGQLLDFDVQSVPNVKLYENGTFVRNVKAPQGAKPFIDDIRS